MIRISPRNDVHSSIYLRSGRNLLRFDINFSLFDQLHGICETLQMASSLFGCREIA